MRVVTTVGLISRFSVFGVFSGDDVLFVHFVEHLKNLLLVMHTSGTFKLAAERSGQVCTVSHAIHMQFTSNSHQFTCKFTCNSHSIHTNYMQIHIQLTCNSHLTHTWFSHMTRSFRLVLVYMMTIHMLFTMSCGVFQLS